MSQKNMGRLAQDMKRDIIAITGRLKDPRLEGGLLTVTRLDVTPDLDVAKVYVSVMGRADGPGPAIEALNRAAGHVRTEVSKKMHIRKAPRFIFVEDDGAAYAAHINEHFPVLLCFCNKVLTENDRKHYLAATYIIFGIES